MDTPVPSAFKVALISMPWAIFNRPSVQLGALKAYMDRESEYKVDTFHPYLNIARAIGTELYTQIAHSGWAGEALFSPLLFEDKETDAERLFHESLPKSPKRDTTFSALSASIDEECRQWLLNRNFSQYHLIGFTLCFSQLFASLYMARLIKERCPAVQIVFGGSSCVGDAGRSLLDSFREVDFIIDGEGENNLLDLCNSLAGALSDSDDSVLDAYVNNKKQLKLDTLPPPDYTGYFQEMQETFAANPFIPTLPVEFSRGCWWNRCTFCNLNIQWHNYRYKSADQMIKEVRGLSDRFETLNFTFTDNALPPAEADTFFTRIEKEPVDLEFFAEIRSTANPVQLTSYRAGGLRTVQVGIESLSTSLLKRMDKGSTTMDNIAMMKLCLEHDIALEGNLILEFPSSSEKEVEETLANLETVFAFTPLSAATFFLGYGSPVFKNLHHYSILNCTLHPKNKLLFPKNCHNSMTMLINSYRGDRMRQKKLWKPVREAISRWQEFHKRRKSTKPALSCRDGGNFLIIRQERLDGATLHHRMRGLSRKIYLAARTPMQIDRLEEMFPQVARKSLDTFLDEMCRKRLMFKEQGKVLALAVLTH